MVCVVGEDRASNMLPGQRPRRSEKAFEYLFDFAVYWPGSGPSSVFAFLYPDGVEVKPVNGLHVNMGAPINRCVARDQAVLIDDGESGRRFRDFPVRAKSQAAEAGR